MKKNPRKISEKQIKIIAVVIIIAIVVGILLWGMIPGKIYDVSEILEHSGGFDGKEISVRGVVGGWNLSSQNFTLMDSQDKGMTLNITHSRSFPEGFGNNETVIITGIFRSDIMHLDSQSIEIGCPSKY